MIWIWPAWVVAIVGIGGVGLCVFCWMRQRELNKGAWKDWTRRGLMVVTVASMGAAPSVSLPRMETVKGANIYFVVDTTGSMNAEDYDGAKPRLEGVRADIRKIVSKIPGARYSIISFNASATRELPVTSDSAAVESWLQTVKPEWSSQSDGSSVYRPVDLLKRELARSHKSHPEARQFVYLFGDGESRGAAGKKNKQTYAQIRRFIDGGSVLGYGTSKGGKMKKTDISGIGSDYIQDPKTNQIAISKIDEKTLKAVAKQLKVNYSHRTSLGLGIDVPDISEIEEEVRVGKEHRSPVLWPAGIVLILLVCWEVVVMMPRIRLRAGKR